MTKKTNNEAVKFSRFISDFLHDYTPNFLTGNKSTLKSYKDALKLYIMFLESENITPSSLTKACFERPAIEKWLRWLQEARNCSPSTCNVRLASLRVFLNYVSSRDISLIHLSQDAKSIKKLKDPKTKVSGLTREAVTAILATPDQTSETGKRDLAFMILLYATAARLDEILSLKIRQIHVAEKQNPYITIIGKGQKARTIYLLPKAASHIKAYIDKIHGSSPDPEAYLFYSRVGGKHSKLTAPAIDKRLKTYAAKAHEKCSAIPLNLHAHRFRHAKASHWLEDGLNVLQVSFLLGHSTIQTTAIYLEITTESMYKALGTLECETDQKIYKKWKTAGETLRAFCGLK
jgi:site-specific recombinase XerD